MADTRNIQGESAADGSRRWTILFLLTLALLLSYVDRYLMAILLQPIKAELKLSDGQIGLLTGLAFSLFYACLSLPIARLADRGRRKAVIVGSLIMWSAMTACTGAAHNVVTLTLCRFGVGAGEAGLVPAGQALLVGIFPPRQRGIAISLFVAAGSAGLLATLMAGPQLEAHLGWRGAFLGMLAPGLVLAVFLWLFIPQQQEKAASSAPTGVWRALFTSPAFHHMPFAQSALVVLIFAQTQWAPAYMERSFHLSRLQLGPALALSQGVAAVLGTILGGLLADRVLARGVRWPLRVAILSLVLAAAPTIGLYLAPTAAWAYGFAALSGFFLAAPSAPFYSFLQAVAPANGRATALAVTTMIAAILGLGLGPLAIGVLSDKLSTRFGAESLRYSLLTVVSAALVWGLLHLLRIYALTGRVLAAEEAHTGGATAAMIEGV